MRLIRGTQTQLKLWGPNPSLLISFGIPRPSLTFLRAVQVESTTAHKSNQWHTFMTFPKSVYKARRAQTQLKFRGPRPSLSSESVYSSVLGYPQLKINVIDMCDELDAYWGASLQEIAEATTGSCSPRYDKQKANEHLKAVEDPATFGIWRQGATSNAVRLFLGSKRPNIIKE